MGGRYVNDLICCGSRYPTFDRGNNRLVPESCLRRRNEPCALSGWSDFVEVSQRTQSNEVNIPSSCDGLLMDGRMLKREVMVVIDIVLSSYIPLLPEQGREAYITANFQNRSAGWRFITRKLENGLPWGVLSRGEEPPSMI